MNDQKYLFSVDEPEKERLDKFLVQRLPDFSRTRIQNWIKDGFVMVNGSLPEKNGMLLEFGSIVEIRVPKVEPAKITPEKISLQIIFENNDLLVVNKPAGLVVHPSPGHASGTLVNAVLAHAPQLEGVGGVARPGIVHRLDKDTSGLILVAKNDRAHNWLMDQFKKRKVIKIYTALVDGHPPTPQGRIEAPIGRDPTHRQKMAVVPLDKGRDATTEYHQIERYGQHTLIEVHPITGRTHQIRLHMAFIGCPVVGDTVYGFRHPSLRIHRFFLHAGRISIILPGEKALHTFEAPLPEELQSILSFLKLR